MHGAQLRSASLRHCGGKKSRGCALCTHVIPYAVHLMCYSCFDVSSYLVVSDGWVLFNVFNYDAHCTTIITQYKYAKLCKLYRMDNWYLE